MKSFLHVFNILLPVILVSLILIRKDHFKNEQPLWIKQEWNCFNVLFYVVTIALLQLCYLALVLFNIVSPHSIVIYDSFLIIAIGLVLYKILHFKYSFNLSLIGVTREGILSKIKIGLIVFFFMHYF